MASLRFVGVLSVVVGIVVPITFLEEPVFVTYTTVPFVSNFVFCFDNPTLFVCP